MQINCYPYFVWSDEAYSSTQHIAYLLNSGTFRRADQSSATNSTVATSVRCVPDLGTADNCNPHYLYSGTLSGSSVYRGELNGGTFGVKTDKTTLARSVRCVLDLKFLKQKEICGQTL